jgi:hypothetical protein
MSTTSPANPPPADPIPPDVLADIQAVADCVASGKPVPAVVAQRIRARSERVRDEVFRTHGLLDIGVPAIRELRGELPE